MQQFEAFMTKWKTEALIDWDKRFAWHPFTDTREWCAPANEPLVLVEGRGALLRDSGGREYIDGNSSIWTNIHGHNHPHINAAIRRQLDRVAHTSFLGFTNPAAIELARAIVDLFPKDSLSRVFFSDDGSTGIEVSLRIADQYWQLRHSRKHQFIAFKSGYDARRQGIGGHFTNRGSKDCSRGDRAADSGSGRDAPLAGRHLAGCSGVVRSHRYAAYCRRGHDRFWENGSNVCN